MQNITIIETNQTWNQIIVELNLRGKDYRLIKGGAVHSSMDVSTFEDKVVLIEGFDGSRIGDLLKLQKKLINSDLIIHSTFFDDLSEKSQKWLIPYIDSRICSDMKICYGRVNKYKLDSYKFSTKKTGQMMKL